MKYCKHNLILIIIGFCIILSNSCKKVISPNPEIVFTPEPYPVDTSFMKPQWYTRLDSVSKEEDVIRTYYTLMGWDPSKISIDSLSSAFKYFDEVHRRNDPESYDIKMKYETIYYNEDSKVVLITDF